MLGSLSSRVVLADLISAAIDGARARGQGRMWPHDLEGEIYRQLERALTAQDQRAAVLRTEIAEVLAETDALRAVLSGAIETGNERLRNDVISAIDTLSGGYPEMAFLLRASDHQTAQMQRRLDGQGAEFRALSDTIRRQSADVRIAREELAAIKHRQARAARGEAADAGGGPRWDAGCPYRGLLPFDQEHAEVFLRSATAHGRTDRQASGTPRRAQHGHPVRRIGGGQIVLATRGSAPGAGRGHPVGRLRSLASCRHDADRRSADRAGEPPGHAERR